MHINSAYLDRHEQGKAALSEPQLHLLLDGDSRLGDDVFAGDAKVHVALSNVLRKI